jgi:hypothetical protein
MNLKIYLTFLSLAIVLLFSGQSISARNAKQKKNVIFWNMSDFLIAGASVHLTGNPKLIEYKKSKALEFNGLNDGVFLDKLPILGMNEFTIEAIFRPDNGGNFEQRFFHTGEIRGDRVLLEIRTTTKDWYFDAYVQSGNEKMTLIESKLLHPLDQWYHVAYVVDHGELYTYINGQKELEGSIKFSPIQTGKTSIGVRLNEQSWFKGAISQIRISPKALKPNEFLNL